MELIWAVLFVFFVIAEILSVQLISIWFAVGSLASLLGVHFFDIPIMAQLAVFIIVSAVMIAVSFPLFRKRLKGKKVATNSDLDVGQTASVIEEINVNNGTGRVTLNGVDWSAVPENSGDVIAKGSIVTVREVSGAKLIVVLKSEKSSEALN